MPRKPKSDKPVTPLRELPKRKARSRSVQRLTTTVVQRPKTVKALKEKPKGEKAKKPKYLTMIKKAIKDTNAGRKGVADSTIIKYIEANYPVYGNFKPRVRLALRRGVEKKELVQKKRHFSVATKPKKTKKAKKTKATKKTAKKTKKTKKTKKSATKKAGKESPKKAAKKTTKKPAAKKGEKKSPRKAATKKATKETKETPTKKRTRSQSNEKPEPKTRRAKKARKERDSEEEATNKPKPKGRGKKTESRSSRSAKDSTTSASSGELVWAWQFLENDKLYYNYDPEASDVVEEVYQQYLKSPGATDVRSVKSGQWNYMVDFREMTQQNIQHESHTKRKIRRVQIPASEKNDTSKSYAPDS